MTENKEPAALEVIEAKMAAMDDLIKYAYHTKRFGPIMPEILFVAGKIKAGHDKLTGKERKIVTPEEAARGI